ncbi:TerC/Alx family metal homeostasis membrane protein [Clostridium sp. BJN0001]|uniref:TerC/Alx family metal homeostasis membrane protein n=1 Tax=Clostridium sp. BJN0001 TaxID=2930219 RepID=UPI001FD211C4|nr:TerC/Alx family metal homeostasis membrane protein [Clostridium sp. BJN0001]
MKTKKSLINLVFWISLSLLFNIFIYYLKGYDSAIDYLGGYIIEMSLSIDNLFLFLMVFSEFHIDEKYQERVLLYGVFGAMILRFIFIILGIRIINAFSFMLSIFGIVIIMSGLKMFLGIEKNENFHNKHIVKIIEKFIPITDRIYGHKFFIKKNNIIYGTPLLLSLLVIEFSDIIFALDSIPAIFSITTDTFIVYFSNIFAILVLRSMYYILAKMNSMFKFMKYGVGFILIFTGIKLVLSDFSYKISSSISILFIVSILLFFILLSLLIKEKGH